MASSGSGPNTISSCCLSGKVQTGKPTGRIDQIGGIQTYIAEPEDGKPTRSIVFLTDLFGWEFPNTRLLADLFARAGFYVYVPDVHEGDSVPASFLQTVEPSLKSREDLTVTDKAKNAALVPATLGAWLPNHREAVTRPIIDGFVNAVRMVPGTHKLGAVGFCWGGRYAILQAHGQKKDGAGSSVGGVDAAVAYHPSLLSVPGDFEDVSVPLSMAFGDKDSLVDMNTVGQIQDVMGQKLDLPKEIRVCVSMDFPSTFHKSITAGLTCAQIYENQIHGFALRSDWSDDKDKKAMDEAAQQGIDWLNKYLA